MKTVAEVQQQADESAETEAEAASSAPEPPDCKGQLEDHRTLRGLYQPRDPRFMAKAIPTEELLWDPYRLGPPEAAPASPT